MRFLNNSQLVLFCLALYFGSACCGSEDAANPPVVGPRPQFPVAGVVNTFGGNLLKAYRATNPHGNVVFSPLSLVTAFHLLYRGSAGQTKTELETVFKFGTDAVNSALEAKPDLLNSDDTALLASRLYVDLKVGLIQAYREMIGDDSIEGVDFFGETEAARDTINEWVEEQTGGFIPELISAGALSPDTLLVIVNALFFDGKWERPFPIEATEDGVFRGLNGNETVPFMKLTDLTLTYKEHPELKGELVELPYSNDEYSMYIFVPSHETGWMRAEEMWSAYGPSIFDAGTFTRQQVAELRMPKWEMETSLSGLKELLIGMGLKTVFTAGADLSKISETPLQVDDVVHKAKIVVDEEGTKAAAATAILSVRSAVAYPAITINVDRPFLYFIVSNSDRTVLFQGTQTSILGA